jgi:hypothetical protein
MKLETQAAIEVRAVPRARIPVFMISTGYAQERGPMAEENAKLKIQVIAIKAPPAAMLGLVSEG